MINYNDRIIMHKQSHYTDLIEFINAKYVYSAIPQIPPLQRRLMKTKNISSECQLWSLSPQLLGNYYVDFKINFFFKLF